MSDISLPNPWFQSTLGEICSYIQRGKGPKYSSGINDFPVVNQKAIRWHGVDQQYLKYVDPIQWDKWEEIRFIRQGDILWNSTGTGTIGRACYLSSDEVKKAKVVDSHVTIVRVAQGFNSRLAFYWIMHPSVQGKIGGLYTGTTNQVELTKKMVEELHIPLPPLAEQKVIADKLDTLLAQVETTKARLERIPNILKTFRQSVLAAAVSGKLTEEWRRDKGYFGWSVIKFEKLITASANGLSKRSGKDGEEITILRLADFKDASRVYGKERKIRLNAKETEKYSLINGDILIIRVNGSIDLAGKFIRYEKTDEIEGFCDHFIRVRLDQNKILPKYLTYVANEGIGRFYLQNSLSTSAGQNTINQGAVKGLDIPLPLLEEQTEIVRRVEELFALANNIEHLANAALERVNNLTQSILAKAFRGELTADWRAANPELISGENSAEALLEKIKAEREALSLKKKPVKKTRKKKIIS